MNFALMLILKWLAIITSMVLLMFSLLFAFIGTILRFPGNLVVALSNICFRVGSRIAQWLILIKMKEVQKALKK